MTGTLSFRECGNAGTVVDTRPGDGIGYIRPESPGIQLNGVQGLGYLDDLPDTLDLAERARLAIHAMTMTSDPKAEHEIYTSIHFDRVPAAMAHGLGAANGDQARYLEAVALLRIVCGSNENEDVDQAWLNTLLASMAPTGFCAMPLRGRPWALLDDAQAGVSPGRPPAGARHMSSVAATGSAMSALLSYRGRVDDTARDVIDEALRRGAGAIETVVIESGASAYLASGYVYLDGAGNPVAGTFTPVMRHGGRNGPPTVTEDELPGYASIIRACTRLAVIEGQSGMRMLAEKLVRGLLTPEARAFRYDADGRLAFDGDFAVHVAVLIAIADLGIATGNSEFVGRAREGYRFARAAGELSVGHYPRRLQPAGDDEAQRSAVSDASGLAQLVLLAVTLSHAQDGQYWDDVDRWVRNELAELQFVDADWLDTVQKLPDPPGHRLGALTAKDAKAVPGLLTTVRVKERARGAFANGGAVNDRYPHTDQRLPGTGRAAWNAAGLGAAAHAIALVWKRMLEFDGETLTVHLPLNRVSACADVQSHVPYSGEIDVITKQRLRLRVRIPEYASLDNVRAAANGRLLAPRRVAETRYMDFGQVASSETVTIVFDLPETSRTLPVPFGSPGEVTVQLKGNTVIRMDPPGVNAPYYQRDHYAQLETRWREARRFQPADEGFPS